MANDPMVDNRDRSGYWGAHILKRKVPTVIYIANGQMLNGIVHIENQFRFVDDINQFITVGHVIVITEVGGIQPSTATRPPTLFLNMDQIVWMAPDTALSKGGDTVRGEFVEKREIKLTIKTSTGQELTATAHIKKGLRSIDDFNLRKNDNRFLSLTNVKMINPLTPLPVIPFMIINRQHIIWIIPDE